VVITSCGSGLEGWSRSDRRVRLERAIRLEASDAFGLTVLGMFEVDAVEAIEQSGRVARIAERDGEGYILTKDYNPNRLNLIIVTGLVASVYVG
jgi:hypothetical protein